MDNEATGPASLAQVAPRRPVEVGHQDDIGDSAERRSESGFGRHRVEWLLRLFALFSHRAGRDLTIGFVAGGLGVALNVAVYWLAGWYHIDHVTLDPVTFFLSGLLGYLLIAFWEELIFRGVLFRVLESGFGTVVALVAESALFGLVHLSNPHATVVGALGTAVGGGVLLSAAYLVTRNLWLAIGIHWAADFWQGAFFGLKPSGTTFEHPLFAATLHGPNVWTGGAYGGGIVGLVIGCTAAAILLRMASQRGHIAPARLPFKPGRSVGSKV